MLVLTGVVSALLQIGDFPSGVPILLASLAVGATWGVHTLAVPPRVSLPLTNLNSTIEVRIADLFDLPHHKAVAVGELLDHELGDRVAVNSVHGQCILRLFRGDSIAFRALAESSLISQRVISSPSDISSSSRLPIGSTAVVDRGSFKVFLPVLTHCDVEDGWKAHADLADLWHALLGLWSRVRVEANGETIAIPLMGSGLAMVNLPPLFLLRTIIESFTYASQRGGRVTGRLLIALTEESYRQMDLRDI